MRITPRAAWAVAAVAATALALPTAAQAATASVSSNEGVPLPLATPQTTASLAPTVSVALGADEANYKLVVIDPAGTPIEGTGFCRDATRPTQEIPYRGNGLYTVQLTAYAERAVDFCKTGARPQTLQFTINATTTINPLPASFLIRDPGNVLTKDLPVALAGLNTGVSRVEFRYAKDGIIGPDGGLAGASTEEFIPTSIEPRGQGKVRLQEAGRYVFVARQISNSVGTPWSAPITVNAQSPFDFQSFRFSDGRGPSYRVTVKLREAATSGKVNVALARGKKTGRFRSIGSAKISRTGTIVKRFTQRRSGTYRIRFTFKGSPSTAAGQAVQGVRFTRRVVFR